MSRLSPWTSFSVGVCVLLAGQTGLAAMPAVETLMPNTTRAFASVGSIETFQTAFDKTQLGELLNDPLMKPFVESLKEQLSQKWMQSHQKLGVGWDDLKDVPTGEVGLAMIQPAAKESATAIVADVTGHLEQAAALLEKINKAQQSQKGVRSAKNIHGATVTVWDVPKQGDHPARQVAHTIKDNILIATDHLGVLEGILARHAGAKTDSLAALPSFGAITLRCGKAAGDLVPHARWFIDPFGYIDLTRINQPKQRGTDMVKILREQGFSAVKGAGGYVNFALENYEMLHRTWIHAPGHDPGPERFTLAARMLELPNGGDFTPPEWVPRDVASYIGLNVKVQNAFESSKTLIDQVVGDEGTFEEVLKQIKVDKHGPKIDIRNDLIANLGNHVVIISDLQMPITPKSERIVVAVETTNPEVVAETLRKWMESPDTRRRVINDHVVWESIDRSVDMPMVTIENTPTLAGETLQPIGDEEEKSVFPNQAVTVAFGQMFVATHIDILVKVLADYEERGTLTESADFQRTMAELAKVKLETDSVELFTRTDDAYRLVYEMLRTGRMPEAESLLGKLLNSAMSDGKEGAMRTQRIDGSKLPDFDQVRRYFGPAAMSLTTEETGWFMTGITLSKETQ